MNDLQIDYFMAVATNRSFTRTSEELFVSQPAISKQIALLERELGAKLFTRNNQRTELTPAGKLYYDLFSRYKAELINTKIEVEKLLDHKTGIIRVGFLEGWDLLGIIPPMITRFKSAYPDIEVVINCCGAKELSTLLLTDGIDIAVTMGNSVDNIHELSRHDVYELRKILLYSAKHRLTARAETGSPADTQDLTPRDFRDDTFFVPWEILDKMITETVTGYMRPYGFAPKLRFVQNHESMVTCVRNDMGVAIMDEWAWAKNAADLRYIPLDVRDDISLVRLASKRSGTIDYMETILAEVIGGL